MSPRFPWWLALLAGMSGAVTSDCLAARQEAKTIDNAAIILCDLFFAQQKPEMSVQDIEKTLCATVTDIAPFLDSARRAMLAGGAARTAAPSTGSGPVPITK